MLVAAPKVRLQETKNDIIVYLNDEYVGKIIPLLDGTFEIDANNVSRKHFERNQRAAIRKITDLTRKIWNK